MESDLHQKIILHQDAVIQEAEQSSIEGSNKSGLALLKIHNDVIEITPAMQEILDAARTPRTPEELMQWMAQTWGCSYESIYQPVWSFLKRMGGLGVLMYAANQSDTHPPVLEELKLSGSFAGFVLLNRISKNHKVALYKCELGKRNSPFYTLKVLLKRNADESVQQDFFKEYEILKSLPKHDNIRNCLYAAEHKGISYLLFEYIDGVSMSKQINKLFIEDKCKIAIQLMNAIDHLHRCRILHGDIHVSNFLIDQENNLHLIDMSMAHYEDENQKLQGDYRSEIFQIGVCLYFLFSGQYPFYGLLLKNFDNMRKSPAPLIKTSLGENIPRLLTHVISKSMEKDPQNRYSTVADMLEAWEQAVHHYESILM